MSNSSSILTPYEILRAQRIASNLQVLESLGVRDSVSELHEELSRTTVRRTAPKQRRVVPAEASNFTPPSRRSSRLEGKQPLANYEDHFPPAKDVGRSKKKRLTLSPITKKDEVYTEEHQKLLGSYSTTWTLFTDGYDLNGRRIYDPINGKTCHQCRQKTMGHRTACGHCQMLHGQFCGDCLFMRYGENVLETNQNPEWKCPPCRGICNCSFCRLRNGWMPTGQLWQKAQRLGYKSVAHYLIMTRQISSEKQTLPEGTGKAAVKEEAEIMGDGSDVTEELPSAENEKPTQNLGDLKKSNSKPSQKRSRIQSVEEPEPAPRIPASSNNVSTDLRDTPIRRSGRFKAAKKLNMDAGSPPVSSMSQGSQISSGRKVKRSRKDIIISPKSHKVDMNKGIVYEIEKIIQWRGRGSKKQAFIKWKGYGSECNTWEPLKNLI